MKILLTIVFLIISSSGAFLSYREHRTFGVTSSCILQAQKEVDNGNGKMTSTPRSTAVFALMNSLTKKNPGFAIRQLENDKAFLAFSGRDRAFARLLLTTVERRQGQIDKLISTFMKSKGTKVCQSQIIQTSTTISFQNSIIL